MELMHHVLPHVQTHASALGGHGACKVADHVHQDFLATGLQVDRSEVAEVLVDR